MMSKLYTLALLVITIIVIIIITSVKQQELDNADRIAGHRGMHLQPP